MDQTHHDGCSWKLGDHARMPRLESRVSIVGNSGQKRGEEARPKRGLTNRPISPRRLTWWIMFGEAFKIQDPRSRKIEGRQAPVLCRRSR